MAVTNEQLTVSVKVESSDAVAGLKGVSDAAKGVGDALTKASRGSSDMSGSLSGMKLAFSGLQSSIITVNQGLDLFSRATSSARSMMDSTVGSAMRLQSEVAKISTIITDAEAAQVDFGEEILRQQRLFGTDQATAGRAFYESIASGAVNASGSVKLLDTAQKLAIGGVTSLDVAVSGLTSIMAAYNMNADEAAKISDALFIGAAGGKTDIKGLATELGRVSKIAEESGLSLGELVSAVSATTLAGISTSEAVSSVRSSIAALLTPTDELTAIFQKLGFASGSAAIQQKGFAGTLQAIVKETGGSIDLLAKLVGRVEAAPAILAVTAGRTGQAYADMLKSIEEAFVKTGVVTEQAFTKISETDAFKVQVAMAGIESSMTRIGQTVGAAVLPGFQDLLNLFVSLADRISIVAKSFTVLEKDTVAALTAATVATVALGAALQGSLIGPMGTIVALAGAMAGKITVAAGAFALGAAQIALIGGAILGVITTIELLFRNLDKIPEVLRTVVSAVMMTFERASLGIGKAIQSILRWLGAEGLAGAMEEDLNRIRANISSLEGDFRKAASTLDLGFSGKAISNFNEFLKQAGRNTDDLTKKVEDTGNALVNNGNKQEQIINKELQLNSKLAQQQKDALDELIKRRTQLESDIDQIGLTRIQQIERERQAAIDLIRLERDRLSQKNLLTDASRRELDIIEQLYRRRADALILEERNREARELATATQRIENQLRDLYLNKIEKIRVEGQRMIEDERRKLLLTNSQVEAQAKLAKFIDAINRLTEYRIALEKYSSEKDQQKRLQELYNLYNRINATSVMQLELEKDQRDIAIDQQRIMLEAQGTLTEYNKRSLILQKQASEEIYAKQIKALLMQKSTTGELINDFREFVAVLKIASGVIAGMAFEGLKNVASGLTEAAKSLTIGDEQVAGPPKPGVGLPTKTNDAMTGMMTALKGAGQAAGSIGMAAIAVTEMVMKAPAMILDGINKITKVVEDLVNFPTAVVEALTKLDKMLVKFIEEFPTAMQKAMEKLPAILVAIAEKIPDFLINLYEELPNIAEKLAEVVPAVLVRIIEKIPAMTAAFAKAMWGVTVGLIRGFFNGIMKVWKGEFPKIIDTPKIVNDIKKGVEKLTGVTDKIFAVTDMQEINRRRKEIGNAVAEIEDAGRKIGMSIWEAFRKAISDAWEWIKGIGVKIWDGLKEFVEKSWDWVKKIGGEIWEGLKSAVGKAWDWIKKIGGAIWDGLKEAVGDVAATLGAWGTAIWTGVTDAVGDVAKKFGEWGGAIWTGVTDAVGNVVEKFGEWGRAIWQGITDIVKDPKATFASWGQGIWDGLVGAIGDIGAKFGEWGKKIWEGFLGPIGDTFSGFGNKIVEGLKSGINNIGTVFTSLFQGIGQAFKDLFRLDVSGAVEGLKKAFDNGADVVKGAFSKIINPLINILNGLIDAINGIKIPEVKIGVPKWAGGGTWKLWGDIDLIPGDIGKIPGFAQGGLVTGPGGIDNVPAMLSSGEFVMNRQAVSSIGLPALGAMNQGKSIGGEITNNVTVNLKIDAKEKVDESFVKQRLMPVIREELKRNSLDGRAIVYGSGVRR
jgi:TP901 family phage tail tape measure protein